MKFLIALCLFGLVYCQLPHGHDLQVILNHAFDRLNAGDADGTVEMNEFYKIEAGSDINNDSCVTLLEFHESRPRMPAEVNAQMYKHFDHDHDGCLEVTDLQQEFHAIDTNNDNLLSRHEFDHYFSQLVNHVFAGHGNGHVVG